MFSSLSPVIHWQDLGLHDLQTPREGEGGQALKMETRPLSWIVVQEGKPATDEGATVVKIDDDGGGEFIEIEQLDGTVRINAEEWPAVRAAINRAARLCRA